MVTQKQIQANQQNAQKSTGPKSDAGKAVAKMNAITHGLTAEAVVIKDEDPAVFAQLRDDLICEFAPKSTTEFQLVERAAGLLWRLRRVPQIEASLMELNRMETEFTDIDSRYDFTSWALRDRDNDERSRVALGRAFTRGAESQDIISKLTRYEKSLVGMLNDTLKQFDQQKTRGDRENASTVIEMSPIEKST